MTSSPATRPIRFPDGTTHQVIDAGDVDLDVEDVRLADGTRLTEDRTDDVAQELLAASGSPLPDHLKRTGRPSLTAPGQHSPHVGFRVPAELQVAAQAEAARRGVSVSSLARLALAEFLA